MRQVRCGLSYVLSSPEAEVGPSGRCVGGGGKQRASLTCEIDGSDAPSSRFLNTCPHSPLSCLHASQTGSARNALQSGKARTKTLQPSGAVPSLTRWRREAPLGQRRHALVEPRSEAKRYAGRFLSTKFFLHSTNQTCTAVLIVLRPRLIPSGRTRIGRRGRWDG